MPIRIVLAEDHFLLREGLQRLLESEGDLQVVAVCESFDTLLDAVAVEQPDLVITDIRMPPTHLDEGIRAAERFRETNPDLGVVVLSQYVEPGYAHALFDGGTERRAYLLKERVSDMEQLAGAILSVVAGGSAVDPKVVEALVGAKTQSDHSPLHELTPRELDVLREMAEGKNNASIAASLFLTERSIEKVIHSIFRKLGLGWDASVHKRVKAVILYLSDPEMGTEALRHSPDTVT
jgi:DNA-binding NarL/FixJ family response regulator